MLKIEDNIIRLTRGDKANITLRIPLSSEENYEFQIGDIITLGIYEKKGLEKEALLLKEYEVETETDAYNMELTSEETKLGELSSKPTTYWYEVVLNHDTTVIGYDEEGAKQFVLYPEGSEVE